MTNEKALEAFENLYKDIDKDNHLFVGTINPEMIQIAIDSITQVIETVACSRCIYYTKDDSGRTGICDYHKG